MLEPKELKQIFTSLNAMNSHNVVGTGLVIPLKSVLDLLCTYAQYPAKVEIKDEGDKTILTLSLEELEPNPLDKYPKINTPSQIPILDLINKIQKNQADVVKALKPSDR
jgi:hypothetical protein